MSFGIYIHIPYCVQRCHYCDFTTFKHDTVMPFSDYLNLLRQEITALGPLFPNRHVSTLYFGGGTPSLLPAKDIVALINFLANEGGFQFDANCEITIEINPATISTESLDQYLAGGINRFSVGAQSFNNTHLKQAGRIHSSSDTIETLNLLAKAQANFSMDLLFALPHQTIEDVELDIKTALSFNPNHISAYCLTVPETHPMAKNRALDIDQLKMLQIVEQRLAEDGILKYEISNFARPGFESKHNNLYWQGEPYLGLGLSSHSFLPKTAFSQFGSRFWNPKDFKEYQLLIEKFTASSQPTNFSDRPPHLIEHLEQHEALTDFCHTSLRMTKGLDNSKLSRSFVGPSVKTKLILDSLTNDNLLQFSENHWSLTKKGVGLSNIVFSELTFLKNDL